MTKTQFRISDGFVPFALLFSSAISKRTDPFILFIMITFLRFTTFDAVGCFRNGSSYEPGIRRVERRFWGGLTQCLIGSGLGFLALYLAKTPLYQPILIGSAGLLTFQELFRERLEAIGRPYDALLVSLVSAILLCTGFLLDLLLPACLIILLVSIIVSAVNQPFHSGKPISNLSILPSVFMRDLACPAVLITGYYLSGCDPLVCLSIYAVDRIFRTHARCTEDESRFPMFFLCFCSLIAVSVSHYLGTVETGIVTCVAASSIVLSGLSFNKRTVISTILMIISASCLYMSIPYAHIVSAVLACGISFDKRIFLRKVQK